MAVPAIMAAVGQGMQVISAYQAAQAQAKSLLEEAISKDVQAEETRYRAEINSKMMQKRARQVMGQQIGIAAASGVSVTSGAPLSVVSESIDIMVDQLNNLTREADFEIMQLGKEAASMRQMSIDMIKAANIGLLTGMAQTGATASKAFQGGRPSNSNSKYKETMATADQSVYKTKAQRTGLTSDKQVLA